MVKMENDIAIPSKLFFYRRFVDDIYSRRKKGDNILFNRLNNYHPNIKLTIELNPSKFLDTKFTNSMVPINSMFIRKVQNYYPHGTQKFRNAINELQSMAIFIVQKKFRQNLMKKSL